MPFSPIAPLSDHERATLKYSYTGEFGRGLFAAVCIEFALLVAIAHFDVENTTLIWLISAAPFLGMLAAVFGVTQIRKRRKKSVVAGFEILSRLLGLLAALSFDGLTFTLVMSGAIAVNSMGVPLVSGIYGENFDKVIRGRAVGRLQAIRVASTASFAALAGAIIAYDTAYFRYALAGVALISIACSFWAHQVPEQRPNGNGKRVHLLYDLVDILRRDKSFAYLQLIWFIIGFCNLWLIPLRVMHCRDVGLDAFQTLIATTAILNATQVLTLFVWGRILYRINIAVYRMIVGLLFIAGFPVFFYGETFPVICFGAFLWGTGIAGGALSWRLIGTFFTTPDRLPAYMSIHTFLCGVRGLIGPFLALQLHAAYSTQAVALLSVAGNVLTLFMLVPLYFIMQRRTAHLEALENGD